MGDRIDEKGKKLKARDKRDKKGKKDRSHPMRLTIENFPQPTVTNAIPHLAILSHSTVTKIPTRRG
jgi:hypothetical protein